MPEQEETTEIGEATVLVEEAWPRSARALWKQGAEAIASAIKLSKHSDIEGEFYEELIQRVVGAHLSRVESIEELEEQFAEEAYDGSVNRSTAVLRMPERIVAPGWMALRVEEISELYYHSRAYTERQNIRNYRRLGYSHNTAVYGQAEATLAEIALNGWFAAYYRRLEQLTHKGSAPAGSEFVYSNH